MIAIADYGLGNLKSIYNMFKKVGVESIITSDVREIQKANKYLLPGVGAFDHGIRNLKGSPFFNQLKEEVLVNQKPILGICLGMQLLTSSSEEGQERGLGWIEAKTVKFDIADNDFSIPHMGWNQVNPAQQDKLFRKLDDNRFYFVHSYHVVCRDEKAVLATADYGNKFICGIRKDNIFGVQFHPEKSHKFGMRLLKNFGEM